MTATVRRLLYVGGFDFPTTQARGIQTLHTAHALARAGLGVRLPKRLLSPATLRLAVERALAEPHLRANARAASEWTALRSRRTCRRAYCAEH